MGKRFDWRTESRLLHATMTSTHEPPEPVMIDLPVPPATNGLAAKPEPQPDPAETREWLDALDGVIEEEGGGRASELVQALVEHAAIRGVRTPAAQTTPYVNTIPVEQQPHYPGDLTTEERLRHYTRWNAVAMVVRANKDGGDLGGHLASFSSAATLVDVGFNHFWRGPQHASGGDLVYFQGHSSPGVYARSFLEGRLSEEQLENFRREVDGKGLPSYPHPWLMPDYWQFATVSMGLGPLQAVYQARYMRYLEHRGLIAPSDRKVWAFVGDGEIDEPETLAGLSLATREGLDNLIFVVNANLQRLDGPVRGNGKVIQELEGLFRGAGWNVLKVIWGSRWDPLLAADDTGALVRLMSETLDGDYQTFKSRDGAYVREHFFGRYPETRAMVERYTDDEVWALNRGGHDPLKVYAAYHAAAGHTGSPTVVIAKTIKGYGMGSAGEGMNIAHQQKKLMSSCARSAIASRSRSPTPISKKYRSSRRRPIRARPSTCANGWPSSARFRPGGATSRRRWPSLSAPRSRRSPRPAASASSRPRRRSSARSRRCCATRPSARGWCRSSPTNRAPSAWKGCSASSGSTRVWGSSTARKTPTS